jgi:hypothetical protein
MTTYAIEYAWRGEARWRRTQGFALSVLNFHQKRIFAMPEVSATVCIAHWPDSRAEDWEQSRRITQAEADEMARST